MTLKEAAADTDGDKVTAIESLGRLVRKRFMNQENPVEAAVAWIDSHRAMVNGR